jgi:hypothetical protein
MPKLNPYLIKENYKQVEEVREIDNKELITPEERAKIVDKLVKNEIPSYEEFMKTYEEDKETIDNYYYEIDSHGDISVFKCYGPGFWDDVAPFVGKTILTTFAAGAVVSTGGAAAPLIGAGMWAGGKAAEEIGKETDSRFLRSIGSFTKDTGFGTITGGLFTGEGAVQTAVKNGWSLDKVERINKALAVRDYAQSGVAICEHNKHRERGISYDRNCELCNL